jgi:ABC-type multidrug transport system fused ATPase/permease subunit
MRFIYSPLIVGTPVWAYLLVDTIKYSVQASSKDEIYDAGATIALNFLYLGIALGASAFMREVGFRAFYASQMAHVRHAYYRSVLSHEMGWHDHNNSADVANRLLSHVDRISSAYDFDMSFVGTTVTAAFLAFVLSLVEDWKLTLATIAAFPVVLAAFYLNLRLVSKGSEVSSKAFARGAQVASEDIGLIRTIWTFCTQARESLR